MNRLVVKTHDPLRRALVVLGIAAALALAGWGLFEYGRYRAGYDFRSAEKQADVLRQEKKQLQATIASLREEKAVLKRSREVEDEATKQLNDTVSGLQGEISELKSELTFYRGIVAPKETAGGLRIQRFEVTPNGVERGYRYKLVLTQVLKNGTVARGQAVLLFEGTQNGKLVTLSLDDVSGDRDGELNFRFRYFQDFEGDIVLPKGFTPNRVTVKVDPRGRGHRDFDKAFDWPVEES